MRICLWAKERVENVSSLFHFKLERIADDFFQSNDKSLVPFLDLDNNECVSRCSGKELGNRCIKQMQINDDFSLFFFDMEESWHAVTSVCITGVVFSYILFVLYRHQTKFVVWGFYVASVFIFIGFSVTAFYYASQPSSYVDGGRQKSDLVFLGIFFAIIAVIYVVYIVCQRKRVQLVIQLFKEASCALVNVPTLLIQPIWTLITLVMTSVLFVYFVMVIESSGKLGITETGTIKFIQDKAMMTTRWVNFVAFLWFTQFIIGCQHFVIAGAVSQWYFAKTKTKLDSPVKRSVSHLMRFHLGSICLGSILITIVTIILTIFRFLAVSLLNCFKVL
jgi:solute carrier family 44 (choline transporter-like protein), member 1